MKLCLCNPPDQELIDCLDSCQKSIYLPVLACLAPILLALSLPSLWDQPIMQITPVPKCFTFEASNFSRLLIYNCCANYLLLLMANNWGAQKMTFFSPVISNRATSVANSSNLNSKFNGLNWPFVLNCVVLRCTLNGSFGRKLCYLDLD